MDLPNVLFIGISMDPKELILDIMKTGETKSESQCEDHVESYKWTLDNKYYTADINLCILKSKILTSPSFSSNVEAVVLYFDAKKESCLKDVEEWLPFIKDYSASTQILVCQKCSVEFDAKPKKTEVIDWCQQNEFEFIELEKEVEEEEELYDDDDILEEFCRDVEGVDIILQSLNAHVWPNLVRKERTEPTKFSELKSGGKVHEAILNNMASNSEELEIEEKISELFAGGNPDMDFCELFQQLANMKERLVDMPNERRKMCAEKIALAFWKGMDGEDDEINLNSEDEQAEQTH